MKLEKDYKRKLQLKILDIVKDIDDVCKKNNIEKPSRGYWAKKKSESV